MVWLVRSTNVRHLSAWQTIAPQLMGRSVSLRDLLPLLLAYVTACGSGSGQAHINDEPASLVDLQHLGTNGPELKRAAVAVSRFGHVAFTSGFHEGPELVTVVDSTGQLLTRVGREGHGPGELQGAYYLFFQDSILTVADVFQGRLVQYSVDGEHRRTIKLGSLLLPLGHVRDSIDLGDNARTTGPRVIRQALADSAGFRTLIPRGDTLYQRLIDRAGSNPLAHREGIGSTVRGTLLGDGINYTLFSYEPSGVVTFGRSLPPRVSGGAEADTLSYFGLYSFGMDEAGRLWVAGTDRDGGFLDVYEGTTLLHHQAVDCRPNDWYGVSVAGRWLAMLCKAEEAEAVEVTLQLYRLRI